MEKNEDVKMEGAEFGGAPARRRSRLGKAGMIFWSDVLAFLTFLISTISGLALMRSPGDHGAEMGLPNGDLLWGLSRFEWQNLHTHISIICVVLIAVHLVMHWRWVASRLGRLVPSRT